MFYPRSTPGTRSVAEVDRLRASFLLSASGEMPGSGSPSACRECPAPLSKPSGLAWTSCGLNCCCARLTPPLAAAPDCLLAAAGGSAPRTPHAGHAPSQVSTLSPAVHLPRLSWPALASCEAKRQRLEQTPASQEVGRINVASVIDHLALLELDDLQRSHGRKSYRSVCWRLAAPRSAEQFGARPDGPDG